MDVLQSSHTRLPTQKDARVPLNGSPLDLTFLTHQGVDRASDSPLDLSLKTRKRCADTTEHDDDIIFIAQRTPEKRMCYDKGHVYPQGRGVFQIDQPNGWHNSKERLHSGGSNNAVFPKDIYSQMGSPKLPGRPVQHLPGEQCSNNRPLQPNVWEAKTPNSVPLSIFPQQGFLREGYLTESQRRRIHGAEVVPAKSGTNYPSVPNSGPVRYHTPGYLPHRSLGHPQQVYHPHQTLPARCDQSRAIHPTMSPNARPAARPTSTYTPSTSSTSPKGSHSPFTLPLQPRHSGTLQSPSGSELRAALSSTGRYYPSQTQYSSPVVVSHVTVTQSCSPDTTFSAASACPQGAKTSAQDSRVETVNSGYHETDHRVSSGNHLLAPPSPFAPVPTMSLGAFPIKALSPSTMPTRTPAASTMSVQKPLSPSVVPVKTLSPSAVPVKTLSPSAVPVKTLSPLVMPVRTLSSSAISTKTLSPEMAVKTLSSSALSIKTSMTPIIPIKTLSPPAIPCHTVSPPTMPRKSLSPFAVPTNTCPGVSRASQLHVKPDRCVNHTFSKPLPHANGVISRESSSENLRNVTSSFERYTPNSLKQSIDASAFHSVAKTITPTTTRDVSVKYETPLHISIPCEAKVKAVGVEKPEPSKPVVRDRKLTCKKHMILNAVNQDEELKMLSVSALTKSPPTIRTASVSPPSDQPHSPKMPILSPQHHNPPPLASPFVNEPPPLEPTTEEKLESCRALPNLCVGGNSGKGPSSLAAAVIPLPRRVGEYALSEKCPPCSTETQGRPGQSVACDKVIENRITGVKNLSAFVQTGLVLPVSLLKPKSAWNSHLPPSLRPLSEDKSNQWLTIGPQKGTEALSNGGQAVRKIIPVANVAPMMKESVKANDEISQTLDKKATKTLAINVGKTLDLQAEIAAYKTSLRMPAKLIAKCPVAEDKRTGIAEEFGASKGRFRHIESRMEVQKLRATYGKLFGAKGMSKCHTPLTTANLDEDITCISESQDSVSRNIWESLTKRVITNSDNMTEESANGLASEPTNCSPSSGLEERGECRKRVRGPSRFTYRRVDGKLRVEKPSDRAESIKSSVHKRHKRSMLDEIANSDGYVADMRQQNREAKVDLFADPALLSREERALQKAMMRFTEMETGNSGARNAVQKPKRHSNTRQRANQLKRKALRRSPNKQDNRSRNGTPKSSPGKKGFVDFQPEVLQSRTRMQSKGIHSVGGYNRDAAYENELVNDDRRRELKRARRRAKQMASQRANARKIHREQKATDRDKSADKLPASRESPERKPAKKPQQKKCLVKVRKSPKQSDKKGEMEVPRVDTIKEEPLFVTNISPSKLKAQLALGHLDELPDLIEEAKCVDIDGCWEVRDLASTETLRQTLRSGRKKGGILMKLSWRPMTAATLGKPRIAHARVSRKRNPGPKSLRMLQLRRRAQLAFLQATNRGRKRSDQVSGRKRPTKVIDSERRQLRHRTSASSRRNATVRGTKHHRAAADEKRTTRLQLRIGQQMTLRSGRLPRRRCQKVTTVPATTARPRYPLRDLLVKTDDDDGNTTEEYEFEAEDNTVYSEDDSVYDDRMDSEGVSLVSESFEAFPEPPELRKLTVNKNSGETVLHRAARLGYEEVALYCLHTKMVDVNARDNAGYTPLHEGCVGGQAVIVGHLLAFGADPNVCTQDGMRPIQYPLQNDNPEVVRLLLSYGADPLLDAYEGISQEMVSLINGYFGDLNGYAASQDEIPWTFYGSAVIERDNEVEHKLFSTVPPDEDDPEEEVDAMFDFSDIQQFVSYRLKVPEADSEDNYVILAHILEEYGMTRGAFLRELGPLIRIYSLSRNTLEEEIMHASSICTPLTTSVKQSQTVEVIRLADVHVVLSHKSSSLKGKRSALKHSSGSGNTAAKSKVRRRLLDPDEDYPRGLPPREISRTLSDLSASCNYDSSCGRKSPKMCCVLDRGEALFPLEHSLSLESKCKTTEEMHKSPYIKDNGTRSVLPELLNSSERFLKLNESSTRKMMSQNNTRLPFSLDLNPKHPAVSETWTHSSGENSDLDAKNNNNNNNTKSSTPLFPLISNPKATNLETHSPPIDR